MSSTTEIAIAVVAIAIVIFVPAIRRTVSALFKFVIIAGAIVIAVGGTAVLMNNVSLYDSPGFSARAKRFLTVDCAATSEKGVGSAQCVHGWPGEPSRAPEAASAAKPARFEKRARKTKEQVEGSGARSATPIATVGAEAQVQEEYYPELIRHGYPGISRAKLFDLAQQTVNGLGGWKVVKAEPPSTLDCSYTTRFFKFQDDIRIFVTANGEIDLCSRSEVGAPGSNSWLGIFPGDFGANIGHIKEFYEALEPRVDAVYKEQERKMNAEQPGR